uniref:Membrane transport protein MMPL domain-containing protein n=1 Tax=Eucampia antarctica TaxID=49252 RepID=A0A7S2WDA6_9STRA
MTGLATYLGTELGKNETEKIGVTLQNDNWPATYSDFITTLKFYTNQTDDGRLYSRDIDFEDESAETDITLRVHLRYIPLTKQSRGNTIDDADKQIKAMDATRDLVDKWGREDELPPSYVYSEKFLSIEGFKIIQVELFQNAGLAIMAVGVITFISLGNIVTAFLITLNVFFCIVEILGFMYACGLVINSISVINIVLAVGLSVDYSAHVGHCFMVKSGDRNTRATEALADIGASVLNGALSTFLAVAVLLGSKSYVFQTLSVQFALTVALGVSHGLILLPVLLSIFGPKPFQSAMQSEKPKVKGGEDSHAIQASNWNREAKVKDEKDFEQQ